MSHDLRFIVVGLGIQGYKRKHIAGKNIIATVDPKNTEATYKKIEDMPLNDFDAAFVCTPDSVKFNLLNYLIKHKKHVLVEKPLLTESAEQLEALLNLSRKNNVVCYTAYNHRFEPHFVRMKKIIDENLLGKIYSVRMFYGNGTARLVKDSEWRDQAAGVLPDLGSHLLDTLLFWFEDQKNYEFKVTKAFCHENLAYDHVILNSNKTFSIELEMMLISWRNHFTCDVYAENGSAHIESLCKWGPSRFIFRKRVLPSGCPSEESDILVKDDPTWKLEYEHFYDLCINREQGNIQNDIWLNKLMHNLANQVGLDSVLPNISS